MAPIFFRRYSDVSLTSCSSTRGDFPLSEVLTSNVSTWWISAEQSMPGGVGEEWLQFSFGGTRRVSFLGIRIPPLPMGPLSVREFHVLENDRNDEECWKLASPVTMHTLDLSELQEFAFNPPMDTSAVRLVCTSNAAAGARFGRSIDTPGE